VFTTDLIGSYVRWKREAEVDAIRLRPHPWEFALLVATAMFSPL
jgi:glutamine synthetase